MSITPDCPQTEQLVDPASTAPPTMKASDAHEQHMNGTDSSRPRGYVAGCLIAAGIAAVGGLVLLTGGHNKPHASLATTPPPVASTPTSVVNTPPTPGDLAVAAAETKFLQYVRVSDLVAQGGYRNDRLYDAVAVSPARTQLALEAERSAGIRTTGSTVVATLSVKSLNLSTNSKQAFSEVRLVGCLDVRGTKAFKADGSSAIAATRLPRIAVTALMQMVPASALKDGRPTGWYLSKLDYPGGGTPC